MRASRAVRAAWALVGAGLLVGIGSRVVAADERAPRRTEEHVVQAGETLWDLARRLGPGEDPRVVVDRIMRASGLRSPVLRPGQRLRMPADRRHP
jgi:LysM repeat protein